MKTVKELKEAGNRVEVYHYRVVNGKLVPLREVKENSLTPDPKGGETQVFVYTTDGVRKQGVAFCSNKDNYNKKLGLRIALGRAMSHKC